MVEAENATTMPLEEIRPGIYGGLLSMDSAQKYRLLIRTSGGVDYRSVLGYLCASSTTQKRIFINRSELSNYNYTPYWLSRQLDTNIIMRINAADKEKDYEYLAKPAYLFTLNEVFTGGYSMVPNACGDCRDHGGTSVRPGFWP